MRRSARRTPRSRCRARSLARAAPIPPASICPTSSALRALARRAADQRRDAHGVRRRLARSRATARRRGAQSGRSCATSSATCSWRERRRRRARCSPLQRAAHRAGRRRRPPTRADALLRAADALEARMPVLIGLIVREAGKTLANAIAEVREAVDFLRYYAGEARQPFERRAHRAARAGGLHQPVEFSAGDLHRPGRGGAGGGQCRAGQAGRGDAARSPPRRCGCCTRRAFRRMRCSCCPATGDVGAALVGDARVQGVMFTGSTAVARLIQRQLAERLSPGGRPMPLIAETGGQNAMIVDSSALAEQVVGDVLASAFDSRRPALFGAAHALPAGGHRRPHAGDAEGRDARAQRSAILTALATDVGPVITAEARDAHRGRTSRRCAAAATRSTALPLPAAAAARHLRGADADRDRRHRRCRARSVRAGAACAALQARGAATRSSTRSTPPATA